LWILASPVLVALLVWVFRDPGRWFWGFAAAALLLPPLPFPMGETGPHPAVLFAALGLWRGATRLGQWQAPLNTLTGSAAALILTMLLSVVWALLYSGPAVAAGSAARVSLFAISLYTLLYFAYGPGTGEPAEPLRWSAWLCALGIASALLACLDFYFQLTPPAGFGDQFVWLSTGIYRRAQGVFYEAGVLGTLCSFFLVWIALAWLQPPPRPAAPKWLAAGAVVFFAALLFSFSRASLLNVLLAMAAVAVLYRERFGVRRIVPLAVAAVAGGLLLTYVVFPGFVETYLLRLAYSGLELGAKPDTVLGGRLATWSTILRALADDPAKLLLGVGFKTLPSGGLGEPLVADNMYVSMLAETGLLGLAAMLSFLMALLWHSFRAARSADHAASFLGTWFFCFWIGMLVQMLSVDALTYWRVLPLYFAVAGLAVRERGRYDKSGPPAA
jgi:O-antigen ligase